MPIVNTGRAPLKLFAGQLGKSGRRTPLQRVSQREASRKHREAIRKVRERAEPTVIPYAVLNKIGQMQDRAVVSASGLERSHHLDQQLREKTL
jgi:hypothetical protein